MTPLRLGPTSPDIPRVLDLLRRAFAGMEGRIDPPSSLARMQSEDLARAAETAELWILPGPLACMILTPRPDHLYLGKLAVDASARGRGLARWMIAHAATRAAALDLPALRLQTRIELTENHATFTRLGFTEIARTAHPGYDRPTSLTFERRI
ncbi:GNAT family N-acetyltransferase [Pseudooceanicola sp. CBS1P-1]|uniref:GNAT family N-acetyltransferase n=1 Tax=Pseudooceanicola albus TaxID=2692189 RepID=A0A6L7G700_9RHOB|nr:MULTISPECIES: GNAT family N-acetyltransferase [Pseudooceanicola]MBT9384742.1 GNAT family N-acetyltransferase [Pseudooceanicola endophyticus]MXN18443.1 GNAT family N-acetyltransferase [Pseudooceanicola albus]